MRHELKLECSWKNILLEEFNKKYMKKLKNFLLDQKKINKVVYPAGKDYFRALDLTPFYKVKVVILGQDPYHNPDQAHGLAFSVLPNKRIPPSLISIYKELLDDLGIKSVTHGFLESWATQGVLLLNSVLTVEYKKANSHQGQGWELFTDSIIEKLNHHRNNLVFILWGSYAQKKGRFIDRKRHLVIESAHPSPLSSYRGFFGSKPFSKTNKYLQSHKIVPIDWSLPLLV